MIRSRATREISFSKARQQLSTIIDEVQKPSRSVTIVRHGRPAAVVISPDEFQLLQERASKKKKWSLAGSIRLRKSVDIDRLLEEAKQNRIRTARKKTGRLAMELDES